MIVYRKSIPDRHLVRGSQRIGEKVAKDILRSVYGGERRKEKDGCAGINIY